MHGGRGYRRQYCFFWVEGKKAAPYKHPVLKEVDRLMQVLIMTGDLQQNSVRFCWFDAWGVSTCLLGRSAFFFTCCVVMIHCAYLLCGGLYTVLGTWGLSFFLDNCIYEKNKLPVTLRQLKGCSKDTFFRVRNEMFKTLPKVTCPTHRITTLMYSPYR